MKTLTTGQIYRYKGPLSGVTLADGTEIVLNPDQRVTLPQEHPYVKTLLQRGHLLIEEKVVVQTKEKTEATPKNNKKGA